METIEHFAKISLVARLLGNENLLAREEVERLQELRGTYGIKAPAPICPDPSALGDCWLAAIRPRARLSKHQQGAACDWCRTPRVGAAAKPMARVKFG